MTMLLAHAAAHVHIHDETVGVLVGLAVVAVLLGLAIRAAVRSKS